MHWSDMFDLGKPWWELVVRATIIYLALIFFVRLTGKRQIGQLSPFDLILLLILSEGVQNAMVDDESSITGGLIVASTLLGLNYLVSLITFKSRKAEEVIEGKPEILVLHGKLIKDVANAARITQTELESALRETGIFKLEDVKLAILENNGSVTVESYDNKPREIQPKFRKYK